MFKETGDQYYFIRGGGLLEYTNETIRPMYGIPVARSQISGIQAHTHDFTPIAEYPWPRTCNCTHAKLLPKYTEIKIYRG